MFFSGPRAQALIQPLAALSTRESGEEGVYVEGEGEGKQKVTESETGGVGGGEEEGEEGRFKPVLAGDHLRLKLARSNNKSEL